MSRKKALGVPVIFILLIGVVVAILEVTHTIHLFGSHKSQTSQTTASQDTKGEAGTSSTDNESSTNSSTGTAQPGDTKSNSNAGDASLLEPSGDFVSNHHPALSVNNTMASVCTTTPGATCMITFTQGSITKSLSTQTTDRGGSAYWNWKLQDIGLGSGAWDVQALASLNGYTLTKQDSLQLMVSE